MDHWKRIKADVEHKIDSAYSVIHVKSADTTIKIAPKGSAHASPLAADFVFGIEAIIDRTQSEVRYNFGLDDASDWRIESMGTYEAIKSAALDLCDSTVADMEAATGRKIEDLIGEVRQDILAGQKAGITRGKLSNNIAQYFAETARWKARRIARTEASRGVNYGYIVSTEGEDWVIGYEWLMSSDACDLCQRVGTVDGRPRRWRKGTLVATDKAARKSYSQLPSPPLHPNCFCGLVPILDDDKDKPFDPPADLVAEREALWAEGDDTGLPAITVPPPAPVPPPVAPPTPVAPPAPPQTHLAPPATPPKPPTPPKPRKPRAPKPAPPAAVQTSEEFDSTWYDPNLVKFKASKMKAAREHIDRRLGQTEKWAIGGTPEQVQQFTEHAKKIIQGATPCKRVPLDTAIKIIEGGGRFMSQFETGTSEGALNKTYRSRTEELVLGFDPKNDVKARPQYGYLSYADEVADPVVYARGYGEVIFELKPEAMRRATVTGANSLDYDSQVYGQPLKKPLDDNVMVGVPSSVPKTLNDLTRNMSPKEFFEQGRGYVEFQISGGLSMKDIKRVSFTRHDTGNMKTQRVMQKLKDEGIEVVIR